MVRKLYAGDPPGRPLVRTLSSDCRGPSPWSGNLDPTSYMVQPKNKRRKVYADSFNTRIAD